MADTGRRMTDAEFRRLRAKIKGVYQEAYEDIYKKNLDFVKRHERREAQYRQMMDEGKITKTDFDMWMRGQVFQGKQWEAKRKQMEATLLNADQMAMDMINGSRVRVFADNANFIGYELEQHGRVDTSFGLYDINSVKRLLMEEPDLLPPRSVGKDESYEWYNKQIQGAVTQGIIQGEKLTDIAKRIGQLTGERCMNAMLRNARTMHTGAECAGRIEGMHQAQKLGINVKKRWLATLDKHTRDSHRDLDGQVQEVDDPFNSPLGKIMFPGDPSAFPGNVWNCRCTLTYVYPEYSDSMAQRRDNITGEVIEDMTYREWERMKRGIDINTVISTRDSVIAKLNGAENLFKGDCTPEMRQAVINAIGNDPTMLDIIDEMVDGASIRWYDEEGTCHLDRWTNEISMYTRSLGGMRELDDLSGTFWHEFGHYVDYNDVARYEYRPHGIDLSGIYNLTDANGYEKAVADDINGFLKRMKLDDQFVCNYSGTAYSTAWVSTVDGTVPSPEQNMKLNNALGKWVKEFSGSREAEDYLYTMGYPRRPEWDDYFETYTTPKRQLVRTREKYKGARNDYAEANRKAYDAQDEFRATHDMEALFAEQERLRARVREREEALSYATDTFDGGARGAFFASIWGGHSPEYYRMNGMGEREGIANVFNALVTENPDRIEAMKDLCPNMYNCISNVILGGGKK